MIGSSWLHAEDSIVRTPHMRFGDVPVWMYMSGVMSGLMILGSAFLIPQIGSGPFFVLFVAGQIVTGVVIGHLGWFRLTPDAATLRTDQPHLSGPV